jgi:hypothetical protein
MLFIDYIGSDENEFSSDVLNEMDDIVRWLREERDQYASHEFFYSLLVDWLEVVGEKVDKGKGSKQSAVYVRRKFREALDCKSILSELLEDKELLILYPGTWKDLEIDPLIRQLLTFKALSFFRKHPEENVSSKLLKWKLLGDLIKQRTAQIKSGKNAVKIELCDDFLAEAKMLSGIF